MGCLVLIFAVIINSKSFCTIKLPKFSVMSDVRYWVNQVRHHCAAWLTDVVEMQA